MKDEGRGLRADVNGRDPIPASRDRRREPFGLERNSHRGANFQGFSELGSSMTGVFALILESS